MNDRVGQMETIQKEAMDLFKKKNADSGDAFAEHGLCGILVRLGNKLKKFENITSQGNTLVNDEKLRDTLIDLYNYAGLGILLYDEKTPSCPVLEENSQDVKRWIIKGDHGIHYNREYYNLNDVELHICSCPSYTYSNYNIKTCKHIQQDRWAVISQVKN